MNTLIDLVEQAPTLEEYQAKQRSNGKEAPAFRLYRGDDIDRIVAPRQLVKGYLSIGTVALLVAPSEAGKSTIAVDMVNKVAMHYPVIYVAGEDAANVRTQIRAWELLNNRPRAHNLVLADGPVILNDDTQVGAFIAVAHVIQPRLIIIDTLSSCIPGLDENSPEMTQVTHNLNRMADELNAAVLVLHHPLKYDGETFRGHSSLLNNTHTMMSANREAGDDLVTLKVIRHKGMRADPTTLRIIIRETDIIDPDEGALSAPVAVPATRVMLTDDHLSARQKAILQYLLDLDADGGAVTSDITKEIASKFRTTEGVIRKDIASLVRRDLMTRSEKQRDPRQITQKGRSKIAVDQVDQADQVAPLDPFTINTRLNEPMQKGANLIQKQESATAQQVAEHTRLDPVDPTRSALDPSNTDHVPSPMTQPDPSDPFFMNGSDGSGDKEGGHPNGSYDPQNSNSVAAAPDPAYRTARAIRNTNINNTLARMQDEAAQFAAEHPND